MVGQEEADPTHSAMYGVKLAEKLNAAGIEVVVSYPGHEDDEVRLDHQVPDRQAERQVVRLAGQACGVSVAGGIAKRRRLSRPEFEQTTPWESPMSEIDRARPAGFLDVVTRRGFLRVGGLALGGLALNDVLSARAASGLPGNAHLPDGAHLPAGAALNRSS